MSVDFLQNVTPETIETTLVDIHNTVVPDAPATEYNGGKNGVSGPDSVEVFAPHPNDKADLLKLAVELADHEKDTRELAAMRLGAAVLVVHPFHDGNGRTSRFVHAAILGHGNEKIEAMGIATPHAAFGEDLISWQAREMIDLKPPYPFTNFLYFSVYDVSGLEHGSFNTTLDDSDEDRRIYDEVKARVSKDRAEDLDMAYCIKPKTYKGVNPVDRDSNAVEYALNKLRAEGVEIKGKEYTKTSDAPWTVVDIPRLLRDFEDDLLHGFIDATWEYRRKYADVAIRCVSGDDLGQQVDTLHGITSTVAEHYIRLSNNLVQRATPLTS